MSKNMFVFHTGKTYPHLEAWARSGHPSALKNTIVKLAEYLRNRRNPRSQAYMERLAKQNFPDFDADQIVMIEHTPELSNFDWDAVKDVVLLWPDGNGTGWTNIEREIFRRKPSAVRVVVLNGRRRQFVLKQADWRAFQWRRILEKTFPVEMSILLAFLIISPWLALWDFARGNR